MARTRAKLISAAQTLIAEHGIDALRIADITDRADVGFGSFYTYFQTKDEIVEAIVADTITSLAESVIHMTGRLEDPAEQMSVAIRRIVRVAYDDPELASVLISLNRAEARFETMILPQARSVLENGLASGRFTINDLPTVLTMAIAASLSVITGIVERRLGDNADITCAQTLLHTVGLDRSEAVRIANLPLPPLRSDNTHASD
ncbi:MAG: TetR/AcrR family transcriptional regulator [Solirubrobacteraceae bacterium]